MATAYENVFAELHAALAALAPQIAGLQKLALINPLPETALALSEEVARFEYRAALLQSAIAALTALLGSGYPDALTRDVAQSIYDDIAADLIEQQAALAVFAPRQEVVSAQLVISPPQEK